MAVQNNCPIEECRQFPVDAITNQAIFTHLQLSHFVTSDIGRL